MSAMESSSAPPPPVLSPHPPGGEKIGGGAGHGGAGPVMFPVELSEEFDICDVKILLRFKPLVTTNW